MDFYIYENWTHDRVRLHRGSCSYCNEGKGIHSRDSGRNGRWYGPYTDITTASQVVAKLGRADTKKCGTCRP